MRTHNDTPAILGGPRAVTIDAAGANRWPILTTEDETAVLAVLRDGDLSNHRVTRDLEADYRDRIGRRHALAHCNGTAALLAAFFALDLQPGDEVLVPAATFWASVLPLLWVGAVPVFCEVEAERLGIDPEDAARKVTARTRAIVVTHLWGMPARMTAIQSLARAHSLRIVEDASHALGATWHGKPCGSLGDLSVFSLQGSKLAPAGEGGILLTDDAALIERASCLGDIVRILELDSPARRFAATGFGMKTRMAPLSAAVGRSQLARLDERNARRNRNVERLAARLAPLGFDTFAAPAHIERVYYENLVRYRPTAFGGLSLGDLVTALVAEGCDATRPRYPLLNQQPFFTEGHWKGVARLNGSASLEATLGNALPRTEALQHELLRLPAFPAADPATADPLIDQYAHAFEKIQTYAAEIATYAEEARLVESRS